MLNRIRRFGFRLLYNECAFTYDMVSRLVSCSRWRGWQRCVFDFLPPPDAGPVLELAQGTGDLQIDLIEAGYRSVALDLSPNMGKLARRKLSRLGLDAALLRAEAGRLPLQSATMAAVVCTFPAAFIVEPRTLKEIRRILKPKASAVIVLSSLLTDGGLRAQLIRVLYRLTGQTYSEVMKAELLSRFQLPGLTADARKVRSDGSLTQIVRLTKTAATACEERDHSLDLAREM